MTPEYTPLDWEALDPVLQALLSYLQALARVDEAALCAWAEPQIHQLIAEYCVTQQPPHDLPLWLRERYLTREVAA
ncbi:MAG: hypothetical protein JWO52_4092 [Gammaproteobacteria bacterium]|nr:hypothetical protein [Gammaproteobacteria bacterium]